MSNETNEKITKRKVLVVVIILPICLALLTGCCTVQYAPKYVGIVATPTLTIAPMPTETSASASTAPPLPTATPTFTARPLPISTRTAQAGAMATQEAMDATSTQQAARLLDCDKIDFDILQPPVEAGTVAPDAVNVVTVELTWHVKNKAAEFACQWGQAGEESQLLRALLVGGSGNTGSPVRLKWIQGDEYDLSLDVQLSPGSYALSWRLVLPKTSLPAGPALAARVVVGLPTVYPTQTPTETPCPTVTYDCYCTKVCSGRTCTTECNTCIKEVCPAMTATPTTATRSPVPPTAAPSPTPEWTYLPSSAPIRSGIYVKVVRPTGLDVLQEPGFDKEFITTIAVGEIIYVLDGPTSVKSLSWIKVTDGTTTGWGVQDYVVAYGVKKSTP
jgi:hypothetical protein